MPEIEVSAMTFGPYAVARLDGLTLMVPNAAPGDRLEVSIASRRRDFSVAGIERIIAPGPDRRIPPCPFLPRCGGCDWQQLNYPAQLRAKSGLIVTALRRINIDVSAESLVEPAPEEFHYRSRVRMKAGRDGKLGFYELGSNQLVEIDRCIVAWPSLRMPNNLVSALGRNLDEVEVVESGAVARPLSEDGLPAQPGLRTFENEQLEQGALVVNGRSPLGVVVGNHELGTGPAAADQVAHW